MTAPRQPDLFAALTREVVAELESESAPFTFTGEGCEPGPEPDDELSRWFRHPGQRWNQGDFG